MNGLLVSLQDAVVQGVLWGIMVLGVYITYKLLDIADLTVDGSFALGGCVCAVMVLNKGVDPWIALIIAAAAGMAAGAVTRRLIRRSCMPEPEVCGHRHGNRRDRDRSGRHCHR